MSREEDARTHAQWAAQAERKNDYLGARMEHLKCVEAWKKTGNETELAKAKDIYSAFVKRDPFFKGIVEILMPVIRNNPGIIQSELLKNTSTLDWSLLYKYNRELSREDLSYALYFASEFGIINRIKKGRSYELRLPAKQVEQSYMSKILTWFK